MKTQLESLKEQMGKGKDKWGIRKNTQSGIMDSYIFTLLARGKKVTPESVINLMGGIDYLAKDGLFTMKRVKSHVAWLIQHGFLSHDGNEVT